MRKQEFNRVRKDQDGAITEQNTRERGQGRGQKARRERKNYVWPEKWSVSEMQKELHRGEYLLGHGALQKQQNK